jgi:glycosyltransferase involved in cell wall biosynthesis
VRPFDSLRVALVHDWLTGMRGGEKCLEVLCEMFPRADLFTLVHERGSVSAAIENRRVTESWIARLPLGRRAYRWFVPLYPLAVESFDLSRYDLIVSTSHCAAKGAVTRADALHVCYCFTPVRYFWDLYGEYFGPGRSGTVARATAPFLAHRFRIWDRVSADRVDLFVADSEHVRDRIAKHYRRAAPVVYPPVDTAFFEPSPGTGVAGAGSGAAPSSGSVRPYLVVSALVPYKGVERTIRVANRLALPLRVVGTGPERERLARIAGPTVRFDGWLDSAALREAYRGCRALIQAHEEDFGIAPLEAMACGRSVIAFGKGGAAEVVTAGTGVLYSDESDDGLAGAIADWERRDFDAATLRRHALGFSREAYGNRMDRLLRGAWTAFEDRAGDPWGVERAALSSSSESIVEFPLDRPRRSGASSPDGAWSG